MKDEIILFGFGKIGKAILQFIEDNYRILYWVDNSSEKWGTDYRGYQIVSPEKIRGYTGKIVIATGIAAYLEISTQLIDWGISEEQIFRAQITPREELIPNSAKNIIPSGRSLIEYDQCNSIETKNGKKKILVLCTFYTPFVIQPIHNIKRRYPDVEISILSRAQEYYAEMCDFVSHLYVYKSFRDLADIFGLLPHYDTIHMLWMEYDWSYFAEYIKRDSDRSIVTIGGSDFYRSTSLEKKYFRHILDIVSIINAQTESVKTDFLAEYPMYFDRICTVNYGFESLDFIPEQDNRDNEALRDIFGLPKDKLVVTCGHNANEAHQHIEIISCLDKLPTSYKSILCCVFPMTYPQGKDEYIMKIRASMDDTGIDYRILQDYMDARQMAQYAQVSDIMIHVQTTDMSSATMLEEMYAGAVVIAGSWLPYQWLREQQILFLSVSEVHQLKETLIHVIDNIDEYKEKCRENRRRVYAIGSWDVQAYKWAELWEI